MSHICKPRSVVGLVTKTAHGIAVVLLFGGCGGSSKEPIKAEQNGRRPAEEGDESASPPAGKVAGSQGAGSDSTKATGRPSARDLDPIPAYKDPFIKEATGDDQDSFARDPFQVPENATPQELMAYLKKLDLRRPVGATPDLKMLDNIKSMKARREAADKMLASDNLDGGLRYDAIVAKFRALRFLSQFGDSKETKALRDFTEKLKTDEDPRVVLLDRMASIDLMLEGLRRDEQPDPAPALAEVKALVTGENADMQTLLLAHYAASVFQEIRAFDEAVEALTVAGNQFQSSEDEDLARHAAGMLEEARVVAIQQEFFGILRGDESAKERLLEKVDQILAEKNPPEPALNLLLEVERQLEFTDHMDLASALTDKVAVAFADHEDQELAGRAAQVVETTKKRLSLVGQPFLIEGVTLSGEPFDWNAYRGKVVLVDFWVAQSDICLEEMPYIREIYLRYRDKGFEVVGVSLDDTRREAESVAASISMPWATVVPKDENLQGMRTDPNAVRYGVVALPFVVLVDKEGKAVAMHVRGPMLERKLKEMLGPPTGGDEGDSPVPVPGDLPPIEALDLPEGDGLEPPPADSTPPAEEPRDADVNGTPAPATDASRGHRGRVFFCGLFDDVAETDTDPKEEDDESAPTDVDDDDSEQPVEEINPYSPDEGLSPFELVDFLFEMKEKPRVIQSRPGFTEAVVEAADRLLTTDASDKFKEVAALTKLEYLHKDARLGDEQADENLMEFVDQLKDSERERISAEVEFLLLERRAINVDELDREQVIALLAELEEFFTDQQLIAKHLRVASSTVAAINQLEDDDKREEYFAKFGKFFSDSDDRQLAAYGKKLAKQPGGTAPEVVGREVELAGATVDGIALDWSSYQGKIVLIQFWATWCPACLKEMPQVAAFYEEHREKGVDVVGVNMDKDLDALAAYLEKHDTPWTHLVGEHCQEIAREYGVRAFPTLMLVDREGKIAAVGHRVGDLAETVDKLLGK
jgi:thiol-disulfide isomerase/thioredoxin